MAKPPIDRVGIIVAVYHLGTIPVDQWNQATQSWGAPRPLNRISIGIELVDKEEYPEFGERQVVYVDMTLSAHTKSTYYAIMNALSLNLANPHSLIGNVVKLQVTEGVRKGKDGAPDSPAVYGRKLLPNPLTGLLKKTYGNAEATEPSTTFSVMAPLAGTSITELPFFTVKKIKTAREWPAVEEQLKEAGIELADAGAAPELTLDMSGLSVGKDFVRPTEEKKPAKATTTAEVKGDDPF